MQCSCGAALHRYAWYFTVMGCYNPVIAAIADTEAFDLDRDFATLGGDLYDDAAWFGSYAEAEKYLDGGYWPWADHDVWDFDGTVRCRGHQVHAK